MKKLLLPLLFLTLTGCKIDLSIIGLGTVQTESTNYDCTGTGGTSATGDCSHSYVNDVTQCPGYQVPAQGQLPEIPGNCTVVLAVTGSCSQLFANSVEGVNCVSNADDQYENGLAEVFYPQSSDGNYFMSWGDSVGCSGHAGVCTLWVSDDNAGTNDEIEITASFEPEVQPQTASYTYNHLGQRASKTVGSNTTHFVYSVVDGQLLGEYTASGAPVRQYVYMEGERVAMLDYSSGSKQVVYLANNQVGQAVVGWNSAGEQVYERVQTPFGETMGELAVGDLQVPVRFPGQYADAETGFNQNWNRDYDSSIGRYVQSDPIGLRGGVNTYGYVNQRPVMYVDLKGLAPGDVEDGLYCAHGGACGPDNRPLPVQPEEEGEDNEGNSNGTDDGGHKGEGECGWDKNAAGQVCVHYRCPGYERTVPSCEPPKEKSCPVDG